MRCRLVALALIATQRVAFDVGGYARPPVVARDQLECSVFAGMSSRWRVVARLDDVVAQRGTVWDVEFAFVVQQAFVLFPSQSTVLKPARAFSAESL